MNLKGVVINHMISFKPLQKYLIDNDISKMKFIDTMGISPSTAAKMWRHEYVAMKVIDEICKKYGCKITDVIEHVPE